MKQGIDPEIWGRFFWILIHFLASLDILTKAQRLLLAQLLSQVLPCGVCRKSYHDFLTIGGTTIISDQIVENPALWFCAAHQYVNIKHNKIAECRHWYRPVALNVYRDLPPSDWMAAICVVVMCMFFTYPDLGDDRRAAIRQLYMLLLEIVTSMPDSSARILGRLFEMQLPPDDLAWNQSSAVLLDRWWPVYVHLCKKRLIEPVRLLSGGPALLHKEQLLSQLARPVSSDDAVAALS